MFRLFNIYSVRSRKLLLLKGTYDLRKDQLQAQWEQVAAPFLKISPRVLSFTNYIGVPVEYDEYERYSISGNFLEGDVIIQAPEGYQITAIYNPPYTDAWSWERAVTLHPDEYGTLPICVVLVQFTETAAGEFIRKIIHSSSNLISQYVLLQGEVIEKPEPVYTILKNGLLYNWYAAKGTGGSSLIPTAMQAEGWTLPEYLDYAEFIIYVESDPNKLKEIGTTYWEAPNSEATNEVGFSARGSGVYDFTFLQFYGKKMAFVIFAGDVNPTFPEFVNTLIIADTVYIGDFAHPKMAASVRFFRPATVEEQSLSDGTPCSPYIGNDDKIYKTVKIGPNVWMATNLAETKYRGGELIPYIEDMNYWGEETTYSDWWLPTSGDTRLMYLNLHLAGVGAFSEASSYWTSVEFSNSLATIYNFGNGAEGQTTSKSVELLVRPVRKFNGIVGQYSEGDRGPAGGWIYYAQSLGGDSCIYHEAAPADLEAAIAWSNITNASCGAIYTPAGAGLLNTNLIVAQDGHSTSAAQACLDHTVSVIPGRCCAYDNDPANV